MCQGLDFFERSPNSPLQRIEDQFTIRAKVNLYVKRDDLIDPYVGGNKFRKLKYNLLHACQASYKRLVSVGGAHSNHLYSLSHAAKRLNMPFKALVRGDDGRLDTLTLQKIHENGHEIQAVSRTHFREKNFESFIENGDFFIAEGGTTDLALKGVAELLPEINTQFDQIVVPCGTGGTLAGLVAAGANAIGIEVLKGNFIAKEIEKLTGKNSGFTTFAYPFGGYAKNHPDLEKFMNWFATVHKIEIEFVYSGKMFYGVYDLMEKGYFAQNSTIVAVHTGGLRRDQTSSAILTSTGTTVEI